MRHRWSFPVLGDFDECPRYHLHPAAHSFRRIAVLFGAGHLPLAGGTLDQPTRYLELLELYHGLT